MLDKASYSGLVATETTDTTSNKDSSSDRQKNDVEDSIKVEHLSLDDVSVRETTVNKTEQI